MHSDYEDLTMNDDYIDWDWEDDLSDVEADAMTLRDCGWGTAEDYYDYDDYDDFEQF